MNLENFGENFMIFRWRDLLKSIEERKNQINPRAEIWSWIFKGATWSKKSSWVQSGNDKQKNLVGALKGI
jgi:hypothetical protein